MSFMEIYWWGVGIAFPAILLYECVIDYHWDLRQMTMKEWIEDIICSFFSWLSVAFALFMIPYASKHPEVIDRDRDNKPKSKRKKQRHDYR